MGFTIMNINDHPVMRTLPRAKPKSKNVKANLKTTPISKGLTIQRIEEPCCNTLRDIISQLGANNPILYTTREWIDVKPKELSLSATDVSTVTLYEPIISRFLNSYLGAPLGMQKPNRASGYFDSIQNSLGYTSDSNGRYGNASHSREDVSKMLEVIQSDYITTTEEGSYIDTPTLYLPAYASDLNKGKAAIDRLQGELLATVKTAEKLIAYNTYIRILLIDGTEFNLWANNDNLLIIEEYKL